MLNTHIIIIIIIIIIIAIIIIIIAKALLQHRYQISLTSTQADTELYSGLRFPPFVEWLADTKIAGESL